MDETIRDDLLAMRARDREVRSDLLDSGGLFDGYSDEMEAVHRDNAARLKNIVDKIGWPGTSLVGAEGCEAACLVAQHAIAEPDLQKEFLRRLQDSVARGDAPVLHEAYLLDRILFNQDRPQLYGLVFDWNAEGELSAWIDQDDLADQRRLELGLPPLEEATSRARRNASKEGAQPPDDIDDYHRKRRQWAQQTGWID